MAEYTGLSVSTVAQILRPVPGRVYAEQTCARVQAAALKLGYRPNTMARAIRQGRCGGVGLILSTGNHRSGLSGGLLAGIDDALHRSGQHLTFARLTDDQLTDPGRLPKLMREFLCDGLLINYIAAVPPGMVEALASCRVPSVWINFKGPFDCVHPDDRAGAEAATRRLLDAGHRRIAYLDYALNASAAVGEQHYSKHDRRAGYEAAMAAAGLPLQTLFDDPADVAPTQRLAHFARLLRDTLGSRHTRPTAVLCYSMAEVSLLREAAASAGLSIPRDLSLLRFGGDPVTMIDACRDSGMNVPEHALGELAVAMLARRMEVPARHEPSQAVSLVYDDHGTVTVPESKCSNPKRRVR